MRRVVKILIGNLLVLGALMLLGESGLRLFMALFRPDFIPFERTYPGQYADGAAPRIAWAREDADLGWTYDPDTASRPGNSNDADRIVYKINPQGFRSRHDFQVGAGNTPAARVVLLGDSFLFGVYRPENETITARLEELLGGTHAFYCLAVPGWGLDQMCLAYAKYEARLKPDIVVLLYIDENVERVYQAFRKREGLSKPSFDIVDGRLVRRTPSSVGWRDRLFNRSYLLGRMHRLYAGRKSYAISRILLKDLAERVVNAGHTLLVVRCPLITEMQARSAKTNYDFKDLIEGKAGLYMDLSEQMMTLPPSERSRLYIPGDMHLSAEGSRFVANEIARRLNLEQAASRRNAP